MPGFLIWILANKKVMIAAGVAVALLGLALWFYQRGKSAGYDSGRRDELEQSRQQQGADRKQFLATLQNYQDDAEAAQKQVAQASQAVAAATTRLAQISQTRARDHAAVAALPDAALFGDIVHKLAVRSAADTTPNFLPAELRKLDDQVTDYAALADANQEIGVKVDALADKVAGLEKNLDAVAHQRDEALAYGNRLAGYYATAYNAAQKKPSLLLRIVTLGMLRGRRMELPDPVSLPTPAKETHAEVSH